MVTAIIGKDQYKTQMIATGHELIADEPQDVGGGNFGPSPGQFSSDVVSIMYGHNCENVCKSKKNPPR